LLTIANINNLILILRLESDYE